MNKLSVMDRVLNPFEGVWFVLCSMMYAGGMQLKFGEQVPTYLDLHQLHVHFYNGAVGTQAELDSLNGKPIRLEHKDPLMPVARFVTHPLDELAPLEKEEERGEFSIENASLLKNKDDLIGYAKMFDIKLKKASNISIVKMLVELESSAIAKGLIAAAPVKAKVEKPAKAKAEKPAADPVVVVTPVVVVEDEEPAIVVEVVAEVTA